MVLVDLSVYFNLTIILALLKAKMPYDSFTHVFLPWVYCNPDQDVPVDFETSRPQYYEALNIPLEAGSFIDELKKRMEQALSKLDKAMPTNPYVKITPREGGWISLTPLEPLPEPLKLDQLKTEVGRRWPMTGLLDILKETDLRLDLSSIFKSAAQRENLDRQTLQKRLLLCLYGLGTNTGFKGMSAGSLGEEYRDLLYVKTLLSLATTCAKLSPR